MEAPLRRLSPLGLLLLVALLAPLPSCNPPEGLCRDNHDCAEGLECRGAGSLENGMCVPIIQPEALLLTSCTVYRSDRSTGFPRVSQYTETLENGRACDFDPCTFTWAFPDGTSGSGRGIAHTYERPVPPPGITHLSVTLRNTGGILTTVTCSDSGLLAPQPLSVTCRADPSAGTAPLDVILGATPDGCIGPCHFAWDFGDGQHVAGDALSVVRHTYDRSPSSGSLTAAVVLTDAVTGSPGYLHREAACQRKISLDEPQTPSEPGPPTTPHNAAPMITAIAVEPPFIPQNGQASIGCNVSDADGDDMTVTATAANTSGGAILPPASLVVTGGSGGASFVFQAGGIATVTVTCTPVDSHGLAGAPASANLQVK
jgi:hypothetical protein